MQDNTRKMIIAGLSCFGRHWSQSVPWFCASVELSDGSSPTLVSYQASTDLLRAYFIVDEACAPITTKIADMNYIVVHESMLGDMLKRKRAVNTGIIVWSRQGDYIVLDMIARPEHAIRNESLERDAVIDRVRCSDKLGFDGVDLSHVIPSPLFYEDERQVF